MDKETEIIDLLRSVKYEVLDLKVRVTALELHLKQQDKEAMEILAASRRLMMTIDAIDDGREPDPTEGLQ